MGRKKGCRKPLGTIWEVPDALWRRIEPILKEFWPRKRTGRPPAHWRTTLNGIIFRMRSGCQWDQLPAKFGPKSTVHDWFQRWPRVASSRRSGRCWSRSATNSAAWSGSGRRPTGCWARRDSGGKKTGRNPTDRGKSGTKKHILTDGDGGPLGATTAGANVPDCKLLQETIEAIVVERPGPGEVEQHLCLDAGYDNPSGQVAVEGGEYVGHIRPSRPGKREKKRPGRRKARRWVVERTFGWLSKCRGILVRYDKKDVNYLGLIQLACGNRRNHMIKRLVPG